MQSLLVVLITIIFIRDVISFQMKIIKLQAMMSDSSSLTSEIPVSSTKPGRLFYSYSNERITKEKSYNTRYTFNPSSIAGSKLPPIIFIHGFGGNADQFRKNVPYFSEAGHDSYAIDLLVPYLSCSII